MSHRTMSGALRSGLLAVTLVALGGCAGATDDASTATTTALSTTSDVDAGADGPTAAGTSVAQGTTVPAGWPTGLDLPTGATLLYSTVDADGMSMLFDAPQDLGSLSSLLDTSVTALGYEPESDNGFVDMLSRSWTDGTTVISVTATPVDGRTSGILMVRPTG